MTKNETLAFDDFVAMLFGEPVKVKKTYYSPKKEESVKKTCSIIPEIDHVLFNDPATIIFWKDKTKTVVRADDEPYDMEKGFAMAIIKKIMGNKGNYFDLFKRWIPYGDAQK